MRLQRFSVPVRTPFSLRLTASALRRLPSNRVDVLDDAGALHRAFRFGDRVVAWRVESIAPETVRVTLDRAVGSRREWAARVARMLGTNVDLRCFYRAAREIPVLRDLVQRMRGVKPPRYPTLWEAIVNTVVFQQVSLASAMATMARFVERTSAPHRAFGLVLHPFPDATFVATLGAPAFEGLGLSRAKIRTLRSLAEAVASGSLREEALDALDTAQAMDALAAWPGLGRWSAALILLRGFGRLDVFPAGDSGAARGLATSLGVHNGERLLERLGNHRGMLYYHLLLDRLARAGII